MTKGHLLGGFDKAWPYPDDGLARLEGLIDTTDSLWPFDAPLRDTSDTLWPIGCEADTIPGP